MYYPYLALFWNSSDPAQQTAAQSLVAKIRESTASWVLRASAPGAALFDARIIPHPMSAYNLPGSRGAVFGRLFHRRTCTPVSPDALPLDRALEALDPQAAGKYLIQHYWGAYVGFASDPSSATWMAIRDPSGMIPCYCTTINGVTLFFADVRHLLDLHDSLQINWTYVIAFLAWPHLQIRDTGLSGVQEVLAGEIVIGTAKSRTTGFAWNPMSLYLSSPIRDQAAAGRELTDSTPPSYWEHCSAPRGLPRSCA
jgi:asparagine synthase (glutamine-hydrolysing)